MSIQNKMFLIIGIPLLSILLIFIIGLSSFSRINSTIDGMNMLQNDRATMIDADRDAYQAYLAVIRAISSKTSEQFNSEKDSFIENANQTWERITDPGKRFNSSMLDDYEAFKTNFNAWKSNSEAIIKLANTTIIETNKRSEASISAILVFDDMRNNIDLLTDLVEKELSGKLSEARRVEVESALSLVLNGDRDAYQAFVAQLEVFTVDTLEQITKLDASSVENIGQAKERVNASADIIGGTEVRLLMQQFNKYFDQWESSSRKVFEISKSNFENFSKIAQLEDESDIVFNTMRDNINKLGEHQVEQVNIYRNDMSKIIASVRILYIIIFIIAVILSGVIAFIVASRIISSLQKSIKATEILTNGDLTVEFDVHQNDEIGQLADSLRGMISKLYSVVNDVVRGSHQIASASTQLAEGNQDLSSRTEAQAAALVEISTAIEEMNSTIRANANNTITANQLSVDVSEKAEEGSTSVNQMILSMNEISDSSKKIADIIEVINKIAFQTNLLALNASIEAARAGEHGKGFAVVAVEVRKLAKRSDKAAAEIAEIIKNSNTKVTEGVTIAHTAGEMLTEINNAVKKVTVLVGEISASSQEQLLSVDEIDKTISSLDVNTQKNAALAEEAAAATEELSAQAVELNSIMKFFTLDKSDKTKSSVKQIKHYVEEKKETYKKENKAVKEENLDNEFLDLADEDEFKEF